MRLILLVDMPLKFRLFAGLRGGSQGRFLLPFERLWGEKSLGEAEIL